MKRLNLNTGWRLHEASLDWDRDALSRVLELSEGWMDCALPCDVHMPLEREGRIKNVVEADYSFDAEWIERRSWWFQCEFEGAEADMQAAARSLSLPLRSTNCTSSPRGTPIFQ